MEDNMDHGRSKMISSYGGVGSIIDSSEASIIIETFDKWGYPNYNEKELSKYIIDDDRLMNRLRYRFPKLKHIVSIPGEGNTWKVGVQPQAKYFPEWFYCPHCHRFMHLRDWIQHWQSNEKFDLRCFDPRCKGQHLEQIRFIMTCDDGHIQDLPWEYWNNRKEEKDDNKKGNKSTIQLKYKKCCIKQELYYFVSEDNTDLSGIHIKCKNCGTSATLKGIFGFSQKCFGKKYWLGYKNGKFIEDACDKRATVKIKTSNSVYYANTLSGLWIPEKQILELSKDNEKEVDDILNDPEFEEKDLAKFARRNNISIDIIKQYIERPDDIYIPEIIYKQAEYDYFLNNQQPENNAIKFRQIQVDNKLNGFEKLVKIDRLKKITVQTSFTRNEPIDTDSVLINEDGYEYKVKRQSLSMYDFQTRILPAVENYGEGILFILIKEKLKKWEEQESVKNRIILIQNHAEKSDWLFHKIEAKKITPRKVLIHTLSHLLIKELEYVCGYPMSSLQERLYVSDNMYGFLISAYDGADGYLGGLTKLCNDMDKLRKIIISALQRAKNCSLDPICYESEGQGVGQLNLAACHSCALIPDTSCEMSNLFLDRRLVIDEEFGYFNNI